MNLESEVRELRTTVGLLEDELAIIHNSVTKSLAETIRLSENFGAIESLFQDFLERVQKVEAHTHD